MRVRNRHSRTIMHGMSGKLAIAAMAAMLAACSGGGVTTYKDQSWQGINVHVQASKGGVPGKDMDEIMVMATDNHGVPVHDLLVSVRDSDKEAWGQAIQDGELGVYRKAIDMSKRKSAKIQVRLLQENHNNAEKVLYFTANP